MFDAFILKGKKKHFDFRVSLLTYGTMNNFLWLTKNETVLLYNNNSISLQKTLLKYLFGKTDWDIVKWSDFTCVK